MLQFIESESRKRQSRANISGLQRIVYNLVDNACKYAAEHGPPEIQLSVFAMSGRFEIRVTDHDPGISRDARKHLFKTFSKSVTDAAQTAHGVGQGLSLRRRLACAMQGELTVEQSSAEGTTFGVSLPAEDQDSVTQE